VVQQRAKNGTDMENTREIGFDKNAVIKDLAHGHSAIETLRTTLYSRAVAGQSDLIAEFSTAGGYTVCL
jgi:hypothetical protein